MEHWSGQFDMAEVTRTLLGAFFASLAVVLAIDSTQARVINTFGPWSLTLLILMVSKDIRTRVRSKIPLFTGEKSSITYHCFRVFDVNHTHALGFLRREKTKLNLLYGAQRRLGEGKENVRHRGGCG
jgi:hypothetical protein